MGKNRALSGMWEKSLTPGKNVKKVDFMGDVGYS